MNQARYFLPHLYALSVNSPFWLGQNTGLKAYRQMIFERFPRTGIPDAFHSLSEYEDYLKLLITTNCIDNAKKIWWDIRLHPFFNTIEFRICDAQSRVDDTIALAALMQAIVFKLQKLRQHNVEFSTLAGAIDLEVEAYVVLGSEKTTSPDICTGIEIFFVYAGNNMWLGNIQQIIISFQIALPILKAFAPEVLFFQLVPLDHGPHSPVNDEHALF